jgi:benzoylsuccinyl-CoA thiolase BbsB subunit
MRNVYVLGIGQTMFGKQGNLGVNDLGAAAAYAAVKDAELSPKEFQCAFGASVYSPPNYAQAIFIRIGVAKIPIYNVENACASGSSAVHLLYREIALGGSEVGIAVGVESLSTFNKKFGKGLLRMEGDLQGELGFTMPAQFAKIANRMMEQRGATINDIFYPSIKNHKNGMTNPYSQYKKELTLEQIMASPMIVDPITVMQSCPQSDGAAAVILCSEEYYKKHNKKTNRPAVKVAASLISSSGADDYTYDTLAMEILISSCRTAYELAGIGPQDLNLVELHDAFSCEELMDYEMLGLCKTGDGLAFARSGAAEIGGKCPVNPSGGLLSMGHPLGASGVRVVNDVARQLWGEAGANQVQGAKVGLAQMFGGSLATLQNPVVCGIQILTK